MDESDFDGTTVLEHLAQIDCIDEFFEALDGDDFAEAERLMQAAKIDKSTIAVVLRKMAEADGDH
jgi:hypothetical protein